MCETAAVFHTSFDEMEGWEPEVLIERRNRAIKLAKVMYGG
jgi:hypothetical protein